VLRKPILAPNDRTHKDTTGHRRVNRSYRVLRQSLAVKSRVKAAYPFPDNALEVETHAADPLADIGRGDPDIELATGRWLPVEKADKVGNLLVIRRLARVAGLVSGEDQRRFPIFGEKDRGRWNVISRPLAARGVLFERSRTEVAEGKVPERTKLSLS